jgi:hypothetical protein
MSTAFAQPTVVMVEPVASDIAAVSCLATERADAQLDLHLSSASLSVELSERLCLGFPNGTKCDVVVTGVSANRVRVAALRPVTPAGNRGAYRRAHAVPVVLLAVTPHSRLIYGTTVNLSTSGVAALVPEVLDIDDEFGMRIDVDGRVVVGLAKVVSTVLHEDQTKLHVSIARCRITDMTLGDRDWLSRFVLDMKTER